MNVNKLLKISSLFLKKAQDYLDEEYYGSKDKLYNEMEPSIEDELSRLNVTNGKIASRLEWLINKIVNTDDPTDLSMFSRTLWQDAKAAPEAVNITRFAKKILFMLENKETLDTENPYGTEPVAQEPTGTTLPTPGSAPQIAKDRIGEEGGRVTQKWAPPAGSLEDIPTSPIPRY